ncbi:MAG: helix-turn-helix domain-containing protein [Pseudonocardiaceae bacterium]|nr:helix-turn-helix domain-containing protein [Pseudonocardiaceae bacterium]
MDSVDNVLQLLVLLRRHERLRVSDVAQRLGVARSTAHRLLTMLRYREFATQYPDRTYGPGAMFYGLGLAERTNRDIREVARPHLEWLNERLDETVHLMVLSGAAVTFLDSVEAAQALRVGSRTGMTMPAHLTSGGKALLAELSAEELAERYPDGPPPDTPYAPDDMAGFRRALAAVWRRGYGVNNSESEPGIVAVGACVHDAQQRAVGAITASAPSIRLPRHRIPEIATAVTEAVARARADFGG